MHEGPGGSELSRIPWSPLARGRLARPWGEETKRLTHDPFEQRMFVHDDQPIVDAVRAISTARWVPMAQVALAWVLHNPAVTSPIVGATKANHLVDAAAALHLVLRDDEIAHLEAPYTVRMPAGF